jgi:hypothetical protein
MDRVWTELGREPNTGLMTCDRAHPAALAEAGLSAVVTALAAG